jgi:nucleoside-diphosphate-sugar epimerase
LTKHDLIVIAGAGGFIGGSLARYFHDQGFTRIRAIDKKPLPEWYQRCAGRREPVHGPERAPQLRASLRGRDRGL